MVRAARRLGAHSYDDEWPPELIERQAHPAAPPLRSSRAVDGQVAGLVGEVARRWDSQLAMRRCLALGGMPQTPPQQHFPCWALSAAAPSGALGASSTCPSADPLFPGTQQSHRLPPHSTTAPAACRPHHPRGSPLARCVGVMGVRRSPLGGRDGQRCWTRALARLKGRLHGRRSAPTRIDRTLAALGRPRMARSRLGEATSTDIRPACSPCPPHAARAGAWISTSECPSRASRRSTRRTRWAGLDLRWRQRWMGGPPGAAPLACSAWGPRARGERAPGTEQPAGVQPRPRGCCLRCAAWHAHADTARRRRPAAAVLQVRITSQGKSRSYISYGTRCAPLLC